MSNILFISPSFYPNIGGVEKHVYMIGKKMVSDGHDVSILTPSPNKDLKECESIEGMKVYRFPGNGFKVLRIFITWVYIFKALRSRDYDLIHCHDYSSFIYWLGPSFLYCLMKKKPVFVTFHGWEGFFPPKKSTIFIRRFVNRLASGSIAVGAFIENWYGTSSDIVNYGAGLDYIERDPIIKKDLVLYLGRLEPDTGIKAYLEGWNKFKSSYPDSLERLVLCGDGSLAEELKAYCKANYLADVEFKGFVENPKEYLLDSKVTLTSGYLGIMEAFSCGCSVVSYYDNTLKKDYLECFPASEFIHVTSDSDEIKRALKVSLTQESDLMGSIIEYSKNNDWSSICADYYKLWGLDA